MRNPTLAGLALVFLVAGAAAPTFAEDSRRELIRKILPSAVQIVLEQDGTQIRAGSGVVLARRGSAGTGVDCYVLTAGHLFTGWTGQEIYALLGRHRAGAGNRMRATLLVRRDAGTPDVAVLRIPPDSGCPGAELGEAPTLGDDVVAVGFPWGKSMTLAHGMVSQVPLEASDAQLMVDASVSYGASGGGVYDAGGRLIGIVEGYRSAQVSYRDGGKDAPLHSFQIPVPGETYVVSLAEIRRFLESAGLGQLVAPTR
jgi:S1-C subfamily serine protease